MFKLSPESIFLLVLMTKIAMGEAEESGKSDNPTNPTEPIPMELYLHDILGGSNPTARPVTGLLGRIYSGQVPFAKPVGFRPIPTNQNGAVPGATLIFSREPDTQLAAGSDGLGLGFGTITVIDDVLTTGPELGSQAVGRARGVYVACSGDATSVMMVFTAVIEGGEYGDSLNFYGIYRIGRSAMSRLAVVGGTGRFRNAGGFAEVRSLIPTGPLGIYGGEALLRIIVYLRQDHTS